MQEAIRKEGPVKAMAGPITVVCRAALSGLAHGGAAIANGDTWAIKGHSYRHPNERTHSCRRDNPRHCATLTELRAMFHFARRCVDARARVTFHLADPTALRLAQTWLSAHGVSGVEMPKWYGGTTLNRFPLRIYNQRKVWSIEPVTDAQAALAVAAENMAAVANSAMLRDSRTTTPYLTSQLELIMTRLNESPA